MKLWGQLYNKMPDANPQKLAPEIRGICLKPHVFGCAMVLCKGIPDNVISSPGGVQAIVDSVYKRDTLSVLNEVYTDSTNLLTCRRGSNEFFANF